MKQFLDLPVNKAIGIRHSARIGWLALCMVVFSAGIGRAALIGLSGLQFPDVTASFIQVNFNSASDDFTAVGSATTINFGGGVINLDAPITAGSFNIDLDLTVNGAGEVTDATGTLTILGELNSQGYVSGILLTGELMQFGYPDAPGGNSFDFLFDNLGGDLASFGDTAGVILSVTPQFAGSFAGNYTGGTSAAVADAYVVPESTTAVLLVAGLMTMALRRRCVALRSCTRNQS